MVMGNFTQIQNNASMVEYVFAMDQSLKTYFVFIILLAILIVLIAALYYWQQDFVFAATNATYLVSFMSFICTLIKSEVYENVRLLSFEKMSFFIVLLVLLVIYKQISEP